MTSGERAGSGSWRNKRKCRNLTPEQADKIFFPKPGGKSKAAKAYCLDCPVISQCLKENLALGALSQGMWAGTTEPERRRMAQFMGLVAVELDNFMPPEPKARDRRLRRIPPKVNELDDPLYGLEGPSDDEIMLMETEAKSFGL